MKNLKTKINFVILKIKQKFKNDKKIDLRTSLMHWGIIFVGSLFLGTSISLLLLSDSRTYPKLNISINNEVKKTSETIIINNDNIYVVSLPTKYDAKIIYIKLKYKKTLEQKFGNTLNNITNENKAEYIGKIDNILLKIDNSSSEFNNVTGELLAIKDLLNNSSVYTSEKKKEDTEVDLNSALDNNNSKLEEIKEKVRIANLEKEKEAETVVIKPVVVTPTPKVEPKHVVVKPVVITPTPKVEPKPVVVEPVVITPIPKVEPKPVVIEPVVITPIPKVEPKPVIIEPVVNTNTDSISISINKDINNILTTLNADIFKSFKLKTLKNNNVFLENGVWYTYVYSKYKNFGKGVIPSEADLKNNGFDKNTTLLLLDNDLGGSFITDYKKVKLISDYIISGITNKQNFLKEVADDKKYLHGDTDELFKKLKTESTNLTAGLSNSSKISKIYDYILRNISYSKQFSTSDRKIFSGILTYQNKDGICGGYTKLNLYMLSFAGVSDVQVIKGFVIDASDFPSIGHAWVKIGYQYYDPTFDDPVGASKTKTYSQYKYYSLPSDLFYTNRYNYYSLPGYLKTESLVSRKNLIKENLSKLVEKYESKNYVLLKSFTFRKNNNLAYNETITIEKLKNIIPNLEVNDYKYSEASETKTITDLKFYTVSDSNIEILLEQINYNLDGYKLLKWDNDTYRLAYNIEII